MVTLYLKARKGEYDAKGVFDTKTKTMTVLKNSVISSDVAGGMFRSSKSVKEKRENSNIKDHKLLEDIEFKSASTAANFVTGRSTNGLIAWKTKEGLTLKELIGETT